MDLHFWDGNLAACETLLERSLKEGIYGKALCTRPLQLCARTSDRVGALRIFRRLAQRGITPSAECFTMMIKEFGAVGRPDYAEEWFGRMLKCGVPAKEADYRSMMEAYSRQGDFQKAEAWLERMQSDGLWVETVTYGKLLAAFADSGDIVAAEHWAERMNAEGVRLAPKVFDALVISLAKAGALNHADKYMQRMQVEKLHPAPVVLSTLLAAAADSGDVQRAEQYFEELQAVQWPEDSDWCALLQALGSALPRGRRRLAEAAEEMAALGYMPDEPSIALLCRALGEPFADRIGCLAREKAVGPVARTRQVQVERERERVRHRLARYQQLTPRNAAPAPEPASAARERGVERGMSQQPELFPF